MLGEVAVVPALESLVAHPRVGRAREVSGAELAHLALGEAEEAIVARILHGIVLDEHVRLGARRVLGDGEDARHVGELDAGLGFEQLLQEHEEHALIVLSEQGVEEHGVPFVHDEAELRFS